MATRMKHHLGRALADLRHEPTPLRIRALVDGQVAVDSRRAVLVWEPRRLIPEYAVPVGDVVGLVPAAPVAEPDLTDLPPMLGPGEFRLHTTPGRAADLETRGRLLPGAGFLPDDADLADHVVLDFAAFDQWLAEDEEMVGHARDPFKRIDVLSASRHVEVRLGGRLLAASDRGLVLHETHLPLRHYLPPDDVRLDELVASTTTSTCAYKGHAEYLSTADGDPAGADIAWRYPDPLDDAVRVRDHVCFWAERTDLVVDGAPVPRPVTPWSTPEEQASADAERLEFG